MHFISTVQNFADIGSRVAAVEKEQEEQKQHVDHIVSSLLVGVELLEFSPSLLIICNEVLLMWRIFRWHYRQRWLMYDEFLPHSLHCAYSYLLLVFVQQAILYNHDV